MAMKSRQFVKPDRQIIIITHNIRSIQNVGAILRTAECLAVNEVWATGYTPNLETSTDGSNAPLLPHVRAKLNKHLHVSALGAETLVNFHHHDNIEALLDGYKSDGFRIVGLEQNERSISLPDYQAPTKLVLLLGEEVHGLTPELINQCDDLIEIPMFGQKESYNVSVATGIALYALTTYKAI